MNRHAVLGYRHNPYEELLLAISLLLGIVYSFQVPAPTSIAATQPTVMIRLWALGMAASGAAGLAGCLWRTDIVRALYLEKAGLYIGAATLGLYACAAFGYAGWRALGSGIFLAGWAVAHLLRLVQISQDIKALQ